MQCVNTKKQKRWKLWKLSNFNHKREKPTKGLNIILFSAGLEQPVLKIVYRKEIKTIFHGKKS